MHKEIANKSLVIRVVCKKICEAQTNLLAFEFLGTGLTGGMLMPCQCKPMAQFFWAQALEANGPAKACLHMCYTQYILGGKSSQVC